MFLFILSEIVHKFKWSEPLNQWGCGESRISIECKGKGAFDADLLLNFILFMSILRVIELFQNQNL